MLSLVLIISCLFQDSIPYKAEDEFSVKFNMTFKKRESSNPNTFRYDNPVSKPVKTHTPLPYLAVTFELLKLAPGEVKLKVTSNNNTLFTKRKIEPGLNIKLFSAYVDDIKDKISSYEYVIYFLSENGETLSRIVIEFDEEGFLLVNGNKKGKI